MAKDVMSKLEELVQVSKLGEILKKNKEEKREVNKVVLISFLLSLLAISIAIVGVWFIVEKINDDYEEDEYEEDDYIVLGKEDK